MKIQLNRIAPLRTTAPLRTIALLALLPVTTSCGSQLPSQSPTAQAAMQPVAPANQASAAREFHLAAQFRISGKVAEIVAATPDARTLAYIDSSDAQEVGFVDIVTPSKPRMISTLKTGGEPTSISITPDGRLALVVVHARPDKLMAIDMKTHRVVQTWPLPAQPDSTSISHDGRYLAIAIEAERQNLKKPMPQAPAGSLVIFDMKGDVANWKMRTVSMLNLFARFPTDPEPEYVSINAHNQVAVTLQENNGLAIVDLASGRVQHHFSLGTVTHMADTQKDGKVSFTNQIENAPREPDHVAWTPRGNLITANEGDSDFGLKPNQFVGGRGFSVFSPQGTLLYDSGASLEEAIAKAGFYPDKRSPIRGVEPEGLAVARYDRQSLAFIGCEQARCIAVYDIENERQPRLLQLLETGKKPEGVLALPQRDLLVSANEGDGTLSIFER